MRRPIQALVLLSAIYLMCGCSMFRSTTRMDISPFAENTIAMVADVSYGLNQEHSIYLRKYMYGPPPQEYAAQWEMLRPVLRGIATYSLALVTISKSNLTEKEKLDQLATFLDRMFRPVVENPIHIMAMTSEDLDRTLAHIREQKKFLDGLRAAQPLVDEVARYSGDHLDATKVAERVAADWILEQVMLDNAEVMEFSDLLRAAQGKNFRSLLLLTEYRGSPDELIIDRIRENDPQLHRFLPSDNKPSVEQLQQVEDRIVFRLEEIRKMKGQIAQDLANFQLMTGELDELIKSSSANIIRTRATIWVWSRAHARLGSGITDPANVDMMAIAQKALKAALPF